jgi:hypothetical protein
MKNIVLFSLLVVILSCQAKWDQSFLTGKWKTQAWTEAKTGATFGNKMDFEFDAKGRYKVDYGSLLEEGSYWITGDFLHTIEDGEAEKKVKILNLSIDSLKIEMNRSGRIEHVLLVKK